MGGRTSTHVANAYHETVFVKVDTERSYVLSMNFSVSGGAAGVTGSASGNYLGLEKDRCWIYSCTKWYFPTI